jgi:GNAT superfamily N-acetyltransferase
MYELILLEDSAQAKDYEALTFPYYRPLLQKLASNIGLLAVGVCQETEPVGLLLAFCSEDKETACKKADVKSLFIQPKYRRQGLGTDLLQRLEKELLQRGCNHIRLNYTENSSTEALNSLLLKCGWAEPENTSILVYFSAEKVQTAPLPHLIDRLAELKSKLSSKYEIFPWTELKESEREAITERMKTDNLWRKFNPFDAENLTDPISSYGVRYEGRVVGWCISHNMVPNHITCANMFVATECILRPRIALAMVAQAINSGFEFGCPKASFRTETSNAPMLKFIERWLTPYIETKLRIWSSQRIVEINPTYTKL